MSFMLGPKIFKEILAVDPIGQRYSWHTCVTLNDLVLLPMQSYLHYL